MQGAPYRRKPDVGRQHTQSAVGGSPTPVGCKGHQFAGTTSLVGAVLLCSVHSLAHSPTCGRTFSPTLRHRCSQVSSPRSRSSMQSRTAPKPALLGHVRCRTRSGLPPTCSWRHMVHMASSSLTSHTGHKARGRRGRKVGPATSLPPSRATYGPCTPTHRWCWMAARGRSESTSQKRAKPCFRPRSTTAGLVLPVTGCTLLHGCTYAPSGCWCVQLQCLHLALGPLVVKVSRKVC